MGSGISLSVSPADRRWLKAIVVDRKCARKHVWRARVIVLTDAGLGTAAIMREAGVSKTCVRRWQERFMTEGRRRSAPGPDRPPGKAPVPVGGTAETVRLTQAAQAP